MFIHVLLDFDATEVISIKEIKQADVLTVLGDTPDGNVSYVINTYEDSELIEELKHFAWEDLEQFIYEVDSNGMLIAKYDNETLE